MTGSGVVTFRQEEKAAMCFAVQKMCESLEDATTTVPDYVQLEIPLCSTCWRMCAKFEPGIIPMALGNDNYWGYTTEFIYR